jgi:thiamine phosphate synthase YjbQ (UPF0047 family)
MKIYSEQISLQSQKSREIVNITTQVKAAADKSGLREGIALVSSLYPSTGIVVYHDAPALADAISAWAVEGPATDEGLAFAGRFGPAGPQIASMLLPRQAAIPLSEARLDLPLQQAVFFLDLDGQKPRRISIKIIGE